jgi:RimJ/RimL family protein N-acetyltransferase
MDLTYKIAENTQDFEQVYDLRHRVFVLKGNYVPDTIQMEAGENAVHLMALRGEYLVGAISLILDDGGGIPMEKYFGLADFKSGKKIAEVRRFAVQAEEEGGIAPLGLMALIYEIAQKKGVERIFADVYKRQEKSVNIYKRIGFEVIGNYFWNEEIIVMMIDLENSPYAKDEEKARLREFFVQKLSKKFEF